MAEPMATLEARVGAPFRSALDAIVARATVAYAAAAVAVACPVITQLEPRLHLVVHHVLPAMLLGYVAIALIRAAQHRGTEPRPEAWGRAAETDRSRAWLAVAVAAFAPVGVLAACVLLVLPGCTSLDAEERGLAVGLQLPLLLVLWAGAVAAWREECRDRLARAADAADGALRTYWAEVAQH